MTRAGLGECFYRIVIVSCFFHQLSFTTVIRAWLEAEVFAHQEPTNPGQAEMGESVPMHMQGNCFQSYFASATWQFYLVLADCTPATDPSGDAITCRMIFLMYPSSKKTNDPRNDVFLKAFSFPQSYSGTDTCPDSIAELRR